MQRTYWSISRTTRGKLPPIGRCAVGTALVLLAASAAHAQIKIGNNPTTINPGSILEMESTIRGVLMPRKAVVDRNTWGLNGNVPAEGMVIYNTTATSGEAGLQEGLVVWKNGQWISVDETPYVHVNSTQTGNSTLANSGATGANSMAVGPQAVAGADNGVAIGNAALVQQAAVGGVAIGNGASVTQAGGVALGAGSVASTAAGIAGYVPTGASAAQAAGVMATTSTQAAVSVGDAANGQYRQITGVAAGTSDSDAANVSQLKAVQGAVTNIDNQLNATSNALNSRINNLDNRINNLAEQVNSNTRMLSGGIAASAAMAVVTPVEPGRYHVSGAVAGYNGQAGVGINLLKRSDNGQTTLHGGVGWGSGGGKAIVRVGFGFSFD